jgi:hypothetical protein
MSMRTLHRASPRIAIVLLSAWVVAVGGALPAEEPQPPAYLTDRGEGIPTSLFGTYVGRHELIVYPFYEYTKTTAFEYKPSELGFVGDTDFLGKTAEHEVLVYLGYGFTDRFAVELEMALYAKTSFDKAADDPSGVPARLEESGFGDLDMQLRWRWSAESASRPEMYSFFELTPPLQKNKRLIGTQDWEASLGFGVVRGFRWGTITGRAAIAWDGADSKIDLGEYAFEYLKRVSPHWRIVATLEGETDAVSLIGEAQWAFSRIAVLKLNCGFGLTEKAPDLAPEVGVLFRF